jgi:hypothetical protein
MRRAPLALAALLLAGLAAADPGFRRGLELAAASQPEAVWQDPRPIPAPFLAFLAQAGVRRGEDLRLYEPAGRPLTHRALLALLDRFERDEAQAGAPPSPAPPAAAVEARRLRVPLVEALERAQEDASRELGGLFDGSAPQERPRGERRGLRFQGLELGAWGETERDELAPYDDVTGALDRVFDWDVKARVRLDSLGATARYRHPENLRSLRVTGRVFTDVPDLAGVESARDEVYDAVGRDVPDRPGGWELGAAAQLDAYWGLSAGYRDKTASSPDRFTESETYSLGLGFTPLGDNEGKPWNWSLFAGVNHGEHTRVEEGVTDVKEGFGWSAGAAFQHALEQVPVPLLNPAGGRHDDGFWLDRFTATLGVSDTEYGPLTARAAVGASAYLTKHLKLSCELGVTCTEDGDVDFSPDFGASLKF